MTSHLMSLVARTVASSALAEDCVVVSGGVEHRTRATWVFREEEQGERGFGEVVLRSTIRFPLEDLGREPAVGEEVRIGGRTYRVDRAWIRGPVLDVSLTEWVAR